VRALRGLLELSWIETKIFLREPLGVIGSLGMPVLLFLIFGRMLRGVPRPSAVLARLPFNITIVSALLIALGSVQSLIAIMAIYREGGILKRLRATPLSPVTILGAHVLVKLALTLASLVPTARFAQPISAAVLYPMIALSGLFFPISRLPAPLRALAAVLPTTHAVSLMQGVWAGEGWSAQRTTVAALATIFAACIAISARWFRWE
jgi:ABC-2 type transport system permease protein